MGTQWKWSGDTDAEIIFTGSLFPEVQRRLDQEVSAVASLLEEVPRSSAEEEIIASVLLMHGLSVVPRAGSIPSGVLRVHVRLAEKIHNGTRVVWCRLSYTPPMHRMALIQESESERLMMVADGKRGFKEALTKVFADALGQL